MSESKEINVQLNAELLQQLDNLARSLNCSRDELIGDAMQTYVRTRGDSGLRESLRSGYEHMGEINLNIAETMLPLENEGSRIHLEDLLGGGGFADS